MVKLSRPARYLLKGTEALLDENFQSGKNPDIEVIGNDGHVYHGHDVYEYGSLQLLLFLASFENEESEILKSNSKFEIMTSFVDYVMSWHKYLTPDEVIEKFKNIHTEKQLMRALERAKKNSRLALEASKVLEFIENSPHTVWSDEIIDSFSHRKFKLLKDETALKKILSAGMHELTDSPDGIRIFYQAKSFYFDIEEKYLIREWRQIFMHNPQGDKRLIRAFKAWHGIHGTGYYYIYIPQTTE